MASFIISANAALDLQTPDGSMTTLVTDTAYTEQIAAGQQYIGTPASSGELEIVLSNAQGGSITGQLQTQAADGTWTTAETVTIGKGVKNAVIFLNDPSTDPSLAPQRLVIGLS